MLLSLEAVELCTVQEEVGFADLYGTAFSKTCGEEPKLAESKNRAML